MLEMWLLYYAISLKKVLLKFYTKSLPSGLGGIKKKKSKLLVSKYNMLWICMNGVFVSFFFVVLCFEQKCCPALYRELYAAGKRVFFVL